MLLSILKLFFFINICYGLKPSCENCIFYNKNNNYPQLSTCEIFTEKTNKNIKYLAIYCRNQEILCGKSGLFYKNKNEIIELLSEYEFLNNLSHGEFVDDEVLNELNYIEKNYYQVLKLNKIF